MDTHSFMTNMVRAGKLLGPAYGQHGVSYRDERFAPRFEKSPVATLEMHLWSGNLE